MDKVCFDIEIQQDPHFLPKGWNSTELMDISVAVLYDYSKDRFHIYGPRDTEKLRYRLETADQIVGFNIWRFDLPVLWKLPERQRVEPLKSKTHDLLGNIWRRLGLDEERFSDLHRGWALDAVAKATLGAGKTGKGEDAPLLYQCGRWFELIEYCMNDVALTRDLDLFIEKYGYVVNYTTGNVLWMR